MCWDLSAAAAPMMDFKPLVQLVMVEAALLTSGGSVVIKETERWNLPCQILMLLGTQHLEVNQYVSA